MNLALHPPRRSGSKEEEKMNKQTLRRMVGGGLFAAIIVVLQLIGGGIRFGTFSISLVLVPIVVGTAVYGWQMGGWLGLVFGAAFDGQFRVVHTAAESVEELSALCSSKYVQGRIPSDCYAQVKAALAAERWVYFSGMPCQVAALKSYLSRDYDTLITQDTACHSVPSPLVWEGYKAELEKQYGGKLTSFSFRNKANGWEAYHIRAAFDNGREFAQPAAESPYQRGFIKGLYSRSSCFVCKFKGIERCSDITLADYWGVKGIQPDAYNPQGTSLILLHSEKGRSLLEGCKDQLQLQPAAKDAFAFNPAMLAPIQKPARYDEFWEGYGQTSFAALVSACCEPTKEELAQERRSKSLLARVMRRLKR